MALRSSIELSAGPSIEVRKDSERFSAHFGRDDAVEEAELEPEAVVEDADVVPFRRSDETGEAPAPRSVRPLLDVVEPEPGFGFRAVGFVEEAATNRMLLFVAEASDGREWRDALGERFIGAASAPV